MLQRLDIMNIFESHHFRNNDSACSHRQLLAAIIVVVIVLRTRRCGCCRRRSPRGGHRMTGRQCRHDGRGDLLRFNPHPRAKGYHAVEDENHRKDSRQFVIDAGRHGFQASLGL